MGTDKQIELIAEKIVKHEIDIEEIKKKMVTKDDHHEVMNALDDIATMVKKIKEDNTFVVEWLKRHDKELENIKLRLQAA